MSVELHQARHVALPVAVAAKYAQNARTCSAGADDVPDGGVARKRRYEFHFLGQ